MGNTYASVRTGRPSKKEGGGPDGVDEETRSSATVRRRERRYRRKWNPAFVVFVLSKWQKRGVDASVVARIAQALVQIARPRSCLIVLGGFSEKKKCHSHVEYFNIDMMRWLRLPGLPSRRSSCASATIGHNIVVAGGNKRGSPYLNTSASYNLLSRKWRSMPNLSGVRTDAASVVYNGQMTILGGHDGRTPLRTCETFVFDHEQWITNELPSLNEPRYYLDACVLRRKKTTTKQRRRGADADDDGNKTGDEETQDVVLVAGGHDGVSYLKSAEMYDAEANEWRHVASMGSRRGYCSMVALDGKAIVVGGYNSQEGVVRTIEEYDPKTDTWTYLAPCLEGRANCALGILGGNKLVIAGGFDRRHRYLRSAEMYDRKRNTWTKLPSMRHRKSSAASVVNAAPFVIVE
eukprot:g4280.t1